MKLVKRLWFGNQFEDEEPTILTDDEYRQKATESLDIAWEILNSVDGWKLEKKSTEGDTVHTKNVKPYGKMFKLTGEVEFPPERLLVELFDKLNEVPKWNPTIIESRKVQDTLYLRYHWLEEECLWTNVADISSYIRRTAAASETGVRPLHSDVNEDIDDETDITYIVTTEGGGGIVSSREFVNLRRRAVRDGCFIAAGSSIFHPAVPPCNKYIRGINGPNCWVMRPIPNESRRCVFQWLLNTNLHGWLPQHIVDLALTSAMLDYINAVRAHSVKLKQQGLLDM